MLGIWLIISNLFPTGVMRMDDAITHFITYSSAILQNTLHGTHVTVGSPKMNMPWCLVENQQQVVRIGGTCNGRDLLMFFIIFLWSLPLGDFMDKMVFSFIGIISIFVFNILRIYGLFQVALVAPEFFQFLHKYLFQSFMYLDMYILWRWYIKYSNRQHAFG
ncbi:MAG: exosortase/archaeosortase family protein [Bacteroidia bacterium]|nr:exosortase/archaeosortase family protein [Bacteroidia bacterium]